MQGSSLLLNWVGPTESLTPYWKLKKWFKLHLHPLAMQPPPYELEAAAGPANRPAAAEGPTSFEVPPHPAKVTVEQANSDFMSYLFDNSKV